MPDLIKLDMSNIWASGGDKVDPGATKVNSGWGVEAVARQTWNWMQNRVEQNLAYMLQKGIPEWDSTTEYQVNKSYVQRNNIVYKAILTSTNQDPQTSPTYWVRAFATFSQSMEALGSVTPAANTIPYFDSSTTATSTSITEFGRSLIGTASAATGRSLLGAQAAHINLGGLSSVVGSVNALPYFTGSGNMDTTILTAFGRSILAATNEAGVRTLLGLGNAAGMNTGTTAGTVAAGDDSRIVNSLQKANNLSDLTNAATARSNLGLGNAATYTVTSTQFDSTVNRLLKTGDFGLGQQGIVTDNLNNLGGSGTGFYKLVSPYTGGPTAAPYSVLHQVYDNERTQMAVREGIAGVQVHFRKYISGTTNTSHCIA